MQILGLLGMYFDAVVVEIEKSSLFFRLALAILWMSSNCAIHNTYIRPVQRSNMGLQPKE